MTDSGFPLSIAPMMEWTDRHYRHLMRGITRKTVLYSEMVTAEAILRGNRDKLLSQERDNPVVLQLGGDNPERIRLASGFAREYGYDSLNLNVGCPSDRVQSGNFGACLMREPNLVSELMIAMREGSGLGVSVKHRIGVDGQESYEDLARFVRLVSEKARVDHFIVHARIAILGGLSPAENRTIPPLRYEDVFRLKEDFPGLRIEVNGGIRDLATARSFLERGLDGVMIGRAAYENPMIFQNADKMFAASTGGLGGMGGFGTGGVSDLGDANSEFSWETWILHLEEYLRSWVASGGKVHIVLRHCLGLFHGQPGGRKFRCILTERMHKEPQNWGLFRECARISRCSL